MGSNLRLIRGQAELINLERRIKWIEALPSVGVSGVDLESYWLGNWDAQSERCVLCMEASRLHTSLGSLAVPDGSDTGEPSPAG